MFFLSSYSFMFSCIYVVFVYFMFCLDRFFIFWRIMELRTLVFMGVCYSSFKNNFSSLLVFFIIQTISALMLLLFFLIGRSTGFTVSILLKLSMFPFYFWYINLLLSFPNIILFFSRTLFKLPSIFILNYFFWLVDIKLMLSSALLTILFGAVTILNRIELRTILTASSVVNNSWFFLSQSFSLALFFSYYLVYSLFLFTIFNSQSDLITFNSLSFKYDRVLVVLSLLTISGLPPFPLFYFKMLIVYNFAFYTSYSFYVFTLMVLTVISTLSYLKHLFNSILLSFSSPIEFLYN